MMPEPELMLNKIVALILFTITDCCNVAHLKNGMFLFHGPCFTENISATCNDRSTDVTDNINYEHRCC